MATKEPGCVQRQRPNKSYRWEVKRRRIVGVWRDTKRGVRPPKQKYSDRVDDYGDDDIVGARVSAKVPAEVECEPHKKSDPTESTFRVHDHRLGGC